MPSIVYIQSKKEKEAVYLLCCQQLSGNKDVALEHSEQLAMIHPVRPTQPPESRHPLSPLYTKKKKERAIFGNSGKPRKHIHTFFFFTKKRAEEVY